MWVRLLILFYCGLLLFSSNAQTPNIEKSGDILEIVLPVTAFASTFIWKDQQKAPMQFIKTMGTSFVITHAIKRLINKQRPNGGNYSFPSGHTSAAFTGAAFIERRYGLKVGIPTYLLASYVGWTRVESNYHDKWDVLGGAIVGIGSAYLFTKPFKNTDLELGYLNKNTTLSLTLHL